jgi:site-specific DNA-cytosine methylase
VYATNFDTKKENSDTKKENFDTKKENSDVTSCPSSSHNLALGPSEAKGSLHRVLIDGLKVVDVEGVSDVWTMSPPCQPFTNTKGAHQLVLDISHILILRCLYSILLH